MNKKKLYKFFKDLKIKSGDNIMLHGDASIIANINHKDPINFFFNELKLYLGKNGTILIPSFTYSFCKKKVFDLSKSKSEVGLFSETFRKRKNIFRTSHPIFSFCISGKSKNYFNNSDNKTCFGKKSLFEKFHKKNGLIIVIGRSFEFGATFLHYIEEKLKVKYRYKKNFFGRTILNQKKRKSKVTYFVRDLNKDTSLKYKKDMYKILNKKKFNRLLNVSVRAEKLFNYCKKKMIVNQNYLIEE